MHYTGQLAPLLNSPFTIALVDLAWASDLGSEGCEMRELNVLLWLS